MLIINEREPVLRLGSGRVSLAGATVVVATLGVVILAVVEPLGLASIAIDVLAIGMAAVATLLRGGAEHVVEETHWSFLSNEQQLPVAWKCVDGIAYAL